MEKELKQNKKETLEEAAERIFDGFGDITKPVVIKRAIELVKGQQERMYSEEEVLKILYDWSMYKIEFELGNLSADELVNEFNDILPYDEWFKQNKKK